MPTYTFECKKCKHHFETFSTIRDYNGEGTCSKCNQVSKQRVYEKDLPNGFVKLADSELTTVGELADRNRDRMSEDHKESLFNKHNEYRRGKDGKMPKDVKYRKRKFVFSEEPHKQLEKIKQERKNARAKKRKPRT